jgi:hypothetical protein
MKRNYTLLFFLLATVSILAQTPEKMSYQVVLRDASNTLLTNQEVGMQISILQTTITGTAVYIETQIATTNINGLVSIAIGSGTSSNNFSAIDWSAGPYFIKTETDPSGGSSYTITGTTQLMSVPFALYAKTSGSSTPGPQGAQGPAGSNGAQGNTGATGAQGPAGNDGANGGVTGAQGPAGTNGTNGTQGIQGETGSAGAQGTAGTNGTNGAQGIQGETGSAGTNGTNGAQGIQGEIGSAGATGTNGTNGAQGIQGDTGSVGAAGTNGTNGTNGTQGIQGDTGSVGSAGTNGTNGTQGLQGDTGDTGPAGIAGAGIVQTLSFTSPNLELSDSGGSIDLTALINDADSDTSNELQSLEEVLSRGNNAAHQIKNVTDPTDAQDATTKTYVDTKDATINALIAALDAKIVALDTRIEAIAAVTPATVGDIRAGGVVFWVDPLDSSHGLVCAIEDQGLEIQWFNGSYMVTGATDLAIGAGSVNTTAIITTQGAVTTDYAAGLARAYNGGGFNDWFLPSKDELNEMYENKATINSTAIANGGSAFNAEKYWSSSEDDLQRAWVKDFEINGSWSDREKYKDELVRAVRAF